MAYWDVNHWRVGYGSDTEGPEQFNVTQATATTKDRARLNLMARIPKFQAVAIRAMGAPAWAALNGNQKAAVTSLVYNYGHLPIHVAPDDPKETAAEIARLQTANGGINRKRRVKEAAMYLKPVGAPPPVVHPAPVIIGGGAAGAGVAAIHWTCGPCLWGAGLALLAALIAGVYLFAKRKALFAQTPPVLSTLEQVKALIIVRDNAQKQIDELIPALQADHDELGTFLKAA